MSESNVSTIHISELPLLQKAEGKRMLITLEMEITARCNNDCRHCYINLPAGDKAVKSDELTFDEIRKIVDESADLGALTCLITGGEPLLRDDFIDIYLYLKRKGLLVSLFTNATLINEEHIKLFKKYPPKLMEVTVYGVTKDTYGCVTRRPGNFDAFVRGVRLFSEGGIKVRYKAMALRSNFHELPEIARFCRENTMDYYRFDPLLHLRYDGDPVRNQEIKSERLTPAEIVMIEQGDPNRSQELQEHCDDFILPRTVDNPNNYLVTCAMGIRSLVVSYNGILRPCSSFWHPDYTYDVRKGSVTDAWKNFIPKSRSIQSNRKEFVERCRVCNIINLCIWCPAHAYLETGELDAHVDYFCRLAHARADAVKKSLAAENR